MINIQTTSSNLSFNMFKSQEDKSENITKKDVENKISIEFDNFKKEKAFRNRIDDLFNEIIHDLLKEFKVHIIKLVSEQFKPYAYEWDSKKDEKVKKFARAMNLADNKVYNLLHDFREQELKQYGWWKYKWDAEKK